MDLNCIVVRYGEIWLKSKNVKLKLEKKLVDNIKDCLNREKIKFDSIKRKHNRIVVYTGNPKQAGRNIARVFGVKSVSPCLETNTNLDSLYEHSLDFYTKGKFRISTQRTTKTTELNSQEIDAKVGAYIVKKKNAKVDLTGYNVNIGIEIIGKNAYIFNETYTGFGGLPLSSQGKVLTFIEENSFLSSWLVMKRGCEIIPFISNNKHKKIWNRIKKWNHGSDAELKKIKAKNKLKFLNKKLKETKADAVLLHNNLKEIKKFKDENKKIDSVVLRPLIGLNKSQKKKLLKGIKSKE